VGGGEGGGEGGGVGGGAGGGGTKAERMYKSHPALEATYPAWASLHEVDRWHLAVDAWNSKDMHAASEEQAAAHEATVSLLLSPSSFAPVQPAYGTYR
jgi:hypothetical protein